MEIVRLVPERIEGRFSGARPGVHHVAWAVPPASVEDLRRELEDRGLPEYLSARLGELDITFHDASASLGHDIEIHVDSQGLRDFFQMVREAPRIGTGRNRFVPPPPDSGPWTPWSAPLGLARARCSSPELESRHEPNRVHANLRGQAAADLVSSDRGSKPPPQPRAQIRPHAPCRASKGSRATAAAALSPPPQIGAKTQHCAPGPGNL